MDMVLAMVLMDMESVMLMLSQRLMLMLFMVLMEDTVLDTALILWDMVMAISATLLLAMAMDMVLVTALMDMESVMLRLSQRPMLSMVHMESMVLDTALILWDMVMAILATLLLAMAVDMVVMGMENVMLMLNQRPMLSMEPMVGMDMDLDTVHTLWDMDTDMAMVMDMDMDLDTVHTLWDMDTDMAMD